MRADAEVVGGGRGQPPGGDDERGHRQRLRIDAEGDLHHGHVAADDDLVDLLLWDAGLLADLHGQLVHRLVGARLQELERVGIHHGGRDAGDHVGPERLLSVQHRAHSDWLPGAEVEQGGHHRGGSQVEGDRVALLGGVARLDVDQDVVADDRGDLEVAAPKRAAELAHRAQLDRQLEVVNRRKHALQVRHLVLE